MRHYRDSKRLRMFVVCLVALLPLSLLLSMAGWTSAQSEPGYSLRWWTVDGGGGASGGAGYSLQGTIGQVDAGQMSGGSFALNGGFWVYTFDSKAIPISGATAGNDGPAIAGNAINFSASITDGSNVNYVWEFGDGNIGSGATVSHVYAAPGEYTATVTAQNSVNSQTASTTVIVHSAPDVEVPIANLTASNDGPKPEGHPIQFMVTVGAGSGISYAWDFGDGTTGSGASTSHSYVAPGIYTATVTATNGVSQQSASMVVTVTQSGGTGDTPSDNPEARPNAVFLPLVAR